MNGTQMMNKAADNIRILTAAMVEKAKSGHPGGAMGGADFINLLYSEYLVYDPENPLWEGRDRFFLDPGHMSPMLYSALVLAGLYEIDEIKQFRQWGSTATGHPELNVAKGIENTSGPLGQGHAYAVGAAMAAKFLYEHTGNPTFAKEKIYTYVSDGGVQEEISQGCGRVAGYLGLDNLIMFYDSNSIQLSTATHAVTAEETAAKYRSWNWNVIETDGNDCERLRAAMDEALKETDRPTIIIGKCTMGKGARKKDNSSYEADINIHGAPLGEESCRNTIINLGGDPDEPFVIFNDVKEMYAKRREELKRLAASRHHEEGEWAAANPENALQVRDWFSGRLPHIDWDSIEQKKDVATRHGSAAVLGLFGERIPNMICASADLSNSDKTEGFLNKTHAFTHRDFSGAFFHAGVSELTMACCCMGMVLHGGIIAACGTFFVFSDYMKPAIRMAALMETPVKFIWTHDSFRVGEDGPTHQPVEHEAQLRLLEKMKNHSGRSSLLVMRPADTNETTVCWRLAMENSAGPSALILSRQNVKSLPTGNDYNMAAKGAYIVAGSDDEPDVVLVASGSEVSTLCEGAELLRKEGIRCRVVSAPSEGLFMNQPKEYRESVIPKGAKVFGLTAGLPITLEGLVGSKGKIWGLDCFGYSAPYKVLDEKFGYTPENVLAQVRAMLGE